MLCNIDLCQVTYRLSALILYHDVREDLCGGPVAGQAEGEHNAPAGDEEEVGDGEDDDHHLGYPEVAAAARAVGQVLVELPARTF